LFRYRAVFRRIVTARRPKAHPAIRRAPGRRLLLLPIDLPWLSLNCGFISKRGRTHSPAAKAFMDNVRQIEKELSA
jgi:DNA-binding transcriptional LysR family regulator